MLREIDLVQSRHKDELHDLNTKLQLYRRAMKHNKKQGNTARSEEI